MTSESGFIYGRFNSEIKNRFLCSVSINGEDAVCHIPSSCRFSNFLDLSGRTVLLKPVESSNARTTYAVYAVKCGRNYILLNLAQANRVIETQLHRRYFSFLGKRKNISHEVKLGNYKTDLFIHDTNTIIEVKSLLAFNKTASFPTVYSERAVNQLREISKLLDEGYNACYMLVSLNPVVKQISINDDVQNFYRLFYECVEKGMIYYGVSVRLKETIPEISSLIKITL